MPKLENSLENVLESVDPDGKLREHVKRWPDSNLNTMIAKSTMFARIFSIVCWLVAGVLLGLGYVNWRSQEYALGMALLIPGIVVAVLFTVLRNPESRENITLQEILFKKRKGKITETLAIQKRIEEIDFVLEGCIDAFSSFAEYSDSWKTPDERKNESRRSFPRGLELFSFGYFKANRYCYLPTPYADLMDDDLFEAWKSQVVYDYECAQAISKIWETVLSPTKIPSSSWLAWNDKDAKMLGRKLGIDSMIASYAEGVPIEMIISGYADDCEEEF